MAERPTENINFKGPESEYRPEIGYAKRDIAASSSSGPFRGYHDIDLLRDLLERILRETKNIIVITNTILNTYNLKASTVQLQDVMRTEIPEDLDEPKDYMSFEQYKAYEYLETRGAKYARRAYEDTVRGPSGTPALDIQIINSEIYNEAVRVEGFLDDYLGDIDDTSEFRILESFQDWAHMALKYTRVFRGVLDAGEENRPQIPEQEITKLSKDQARAFQTLFKTKLNAFNDEISRTLEDIKKENSFQDDFYNKFLGPSVKFRINTASHLRQSMAAGFFGNQAESAERLFGDNIESAVADQMKRNVMFEKRFNELEVRIKARNAYAGYINELQVQGSPVKKPFVDVEISSEEKEAFQSMAQTAQEAQEEKNDFRSSHYDLSDMGEDDAHPQYLLKAGDTITGDVLFGDDATIDGITPSTHTHTGSDGSAMVPGTSITPGTLNTILLDFLEDVEIPSSLRIINQETSADGSGLTNIQLAWDTSSDPGVQFELQLVQIPEGTVLACSRGYVGDYPETACQPWSTARIYLNSGPDVSQTGTSVIAPVDQPVAFRVKASEILPLTDDVFVTAYDSVNRGGVGISLCGVNDETTLSYYVMDSERDILSSTLSWEIGAAAQEQNLISMSRINDTDFLLAGVHNFMYSEVVNYVPNIWYRGTNEAWWPTIALVRATYATAATPVGTLSVVTRKEAYGIDANAETDVSEGYVYHYGNYLGFPAMDAIDESTHVYGYILTTANGTQLYLNILTLDYGDSGEYATIDIDQENELLIPDAFSVIDAQIVVLSSSKIALLFNESTSAGGLAPGWYVCVVNITSGVLDGDLESPTLVVAQADCSGYPSIAKIDDDTFTVLWDEADTGTC